MESKKKITHGYKRKIIHTIVDMLLEKPRTRNEYGNGNPFESMMHEVCRQRMRKGKPLIPQFYLIDSPQQGYLGLMLHKCDIPYFVRKCGMYGIVFENGLCMPVGEANKDWKAFQVHIVTSKDEVPKSKADK